jgi:hypothetical protein
MLKSGVLRRHSKSDAAPDRQEAIGVIALLLALAVTCCDRPGPANRVGDLQQARESAAAHDQATNSPPEHDLSMDERIGGHTLARHVGKTDEELIDRLRHEPQISSASTYTDRATAERVVGAALASGRRSFDAWRERTGRRPNFVLHYAANHVIGRSVSRGRVGSAPCEYALVVLHYDDRRHRFYVLTSYPEEKR